MREVPIRVKTENSRRMLEEAARYAPAGVQGDGRWYEPFPLFLNKAQGSRVWDVDGNEYIDYHGSYGPAVLGHNRSGTKSRLSGEKTFRSTSLFQLHFPWKAAISCRTPSV